MPRLKSRLCPHTHGLVALALALCALLAPSTGGAQVVINELVAKNDGPGGLREPDGGYGDWVELYNAGAEPVDLSGYGLSDDDALPAAWRFPAGTELAPGAYLLVWADDDADQAGLHASFKLDADGERVVLSRGDVVIDAVAFGEQDANVATARRPNGTGPFVRQAPSPRISNDDVDARGARDIPLDLAADRAAGTLTVASIRPYGFRHYVVLDGLGGVALRGDVLEAAERLVLDVSGLPTGSYVLSLDEGRARAAFTRE